MKHIRQSMHNPEYKLESIKTNIVDKLSPTKEYHIEDHMQRKHRIDQLQMRKSYYKNMDVFRKEAKNRYY